MDNFISRSFDRTTGSKQIRQMWPESLHKYLPKEPDFGESNKKKKTRGKKNWQSMGFKTYLEYKQHLAKENKETKKKPESDST